MQTQRAEILSQLGEHGWFVVGEESNLEWWADEIWQVESLWSPVGMRAYISFLVDPMADRTRKKGEEVWAVVVSPMKPVDRLSAEREFTLSLGQSWKERMPEFFGHLSRMRDQSIDNGAG